MPPAPIPEVVNGIPTSQKFRNDLGYGGRARIFKRKDPTLTKIIKRLKTIQGFRDIRNHEAIANLRHVRKPCNAYLSDLRRALSPQGDRVTQLRDALSRQISVIAEDVFANPLSSNAAQFQFETIQRRKAAYLLDDQLDAFLAGNGPGGFRTLHQEYHTERANKHHVSGNLINAWRRANTRLTLEKWGETVWTWRIEDGQKGPYDVAWNDGQGVRYLDDTQRQAFKVTIRGGRMQDAAGHLMHTGPMQSLTGQGRGWGIYVMDFYGNMYVGSHERDRFHHSSFLSGAPVAAAGEIAVDGGRVIGLTNKTGHYRAGAKELLTALQALARGGVFLNMVAVHDRHSSPDWFEGTAVAEADGDVSAITGHRLPAPTRVAE